MRTINRGKQTEKETSFRRVNGNCNRQRMANK